MHILENPEPGEVIHEVGHAIETKLDLYEREDFKNIVEDILKDKSLGDIFYDNVTFVDPIIRIESEKFVSEYQGHIYDFDMVKYINTGYLIEPKQLGDYFTEGYRIYVMNPDLLKEKDKRLYQFIDREL